MDDSYIATGNRGDSTNLLVRNAESESLESEWIDEEDDDDMDFEPEADSLDLDAGLYDPSEDADTEFHGSIIAS
jgi:hypothetical protein